MRCAPEDTVTTRSRSRGSSRLVSAKWPRWLVPICSSKPSLVRVSGVAMTPALLTRTSSSPSQPSANARTEARSARSSGRTSTAPVISRAAASPLAVSRTASVTRAIARASSVLASLPITLFAPVTTNVRPSRDGRSAAVHLLMDRSLTVAEREPHGGDRRAAERHLHDRRRQRDALEALPDPGDDEQLEGDDDVGQRQRATDVVDDERQRAQGPADERR